MRKTISLLVMATALTACALTPFGQDEDEAAPTTTTATVAPTGPQVYEIKNANRGVVRRVRVLLNGRTVDTVVLSKARESATSYCCTTDSCEQIDAAAACSTFKMTCDLDGACARVIASSARP